MNDQNLIQLVIVIGILGLTVVALFADGQLGEKVIGMCLLGFGTLMGYFFRKTQDAKEYLEE